jgi:hypothetical protein
MSENHRKDVNEYSQWCDVKRTGPKQRVYRPNSMRQVDASKELNRLKARLDEMDEYIEAERFNTKRVGMGNVIHNILDDMEDILVKKS